MKGIDGGEDINRDILVGIYDRTSRTPFKPAADHVTQVMKVEQMIVGKKPVSPPHFHFYLLPIASLSPSLAFLVEGNS